MEPGEGQHGWVCQAVRVDLLLGGRLARHGYSVRAEVGGRLDAHAALRPRVWRDGRMTDSVGGRKRARRRRLVALDFFCGAGGLTRGLLDARIRVLGGVDIDGRLKQTYEANNAPAVFKEADISTIDIHELRAEVGVRQSDIVIYAACTPCQPFSSLNQRRVPQSAVEDDRKALLLEFGKLLRAAPPDYCIVENVPGLNNAYGRDVHMQFLQDLTDAGLVHHDGRELDAQDYGVPQVRKRFLLVASKYGPIKLPRRTSMTPRTVRDAIEELPSPVFEGKPELLNHVARRPKPHHLRILQAIPANGGSRADVKDTSILLKCHQENPGVHKDVFGRMSWDGPSPTLTCRCTDVYCGRFAHPEEDRGLSLREAAALQSFADDYEFHGTFFHIAAQIGNAVPVRLAERLGCTVRSHMRRRRKAIG